jgi:hypothetical protein
MKLSISTTQIASETILLIPNQYGPKVHVHRGDNSVHLGGMGSSPDASGATLELALYDLAKKWRAQAQQALDIAADIEEMAGAEGDKEHAKPC